MKSQSCLEVRWKSVIRNKSVTGKSLFEQPRHVFTETPLNIFFVMMRCSIFCAITIVTNEPMKVDQRITKGRQAASQRTGTKY